MPEADAPGGLRRTLERLSFDLEVALVHFRHVPESSYPGGSRPSSIVELHGGATAGFGEHVGWTDNEHHAFAERARRLASGKYTLEEFAATLSRLPAYDRAAFEAAAIDLALQQNDTSLFALAGARSQSVRYVVSFASAADPVAEAARIAPGDVELKIDADPSWTDDVWRALARLERIAVVDFKLTGEASDHERACGHLPDAWIEDAKPAVGWSAALASRYSADAAVTSLAALEALEPCPSAVNVKPARMGSVLDAIECLALCRAAGIATYIGGMFEVGAGRDQLRMLAAIACPEGPNDVAPLVAHGRRPARLPVDAGACGFATRPAPGARRAGAGAGAGDTT